MYNKSFDTSKPVQTRNGHPARIFCTDLKGSGDWPILFGYTVNGQETWARRRLDGRVEGGKESPLDIVNVPEHKFYNLYASETGVYLGLKKDSFEEALNKANQIECLCLGVFEITENNNFVAFHPIDKEISK